MQQENPLEGMKINKKRKCRYSRSINFGKCKLFRGGKVIRQAKTRVLELRMLFQFLSCDHDGN